MVTYIDEIKRAGDIVDKPDPLIEEPAPDDRDRDRHQRIGDEDDGAIDVASANLRTDEECQAQRDDDCHGRAGDEDERVPERLPEHVVVKHVLVLVEAGPADRPERRPVRERQRDVPEKRNDAIEQENRERRRQEAPDQRRPADALSRQAGRTIGERRSDCHVEGRPARTSRCSGLAPC